MHCTQVRDLLEAFALGALDADDESRVDAHLATCSRCQGLAKDYSDLTRSFPEALAAASTIGPPAALKQGLLQRIQNSSAGSTNAHADPAGQEVSASAVTALRSSSRWWPWHWRPRTVTMAAAIILVVLLLGLSVRLSVALAQQQVLRAEFANVVSQQETVFDVVDSPKTVKVRLQPPGPGSAAYGKIYTRPDLPYVVVMAARLPPPPAGQAYQLWLTSQGQPQLAGIVAVNDQGFGALVYRADHDGPVYQSAELIVQPQGSTTPAGTPTLVWHSSPDRP